MKRKNPTIQGPYGEIFQPDSDIQLRVLALFGMFIAMALILIAEVVMTDDTTIRRATRPTPMFRWSFR